MLADNLNMFMNNIFSPTFISFADAYIIFIADIYLNKIA